MRRANISFIGGGHMTRAIVLGLLASGYPAAYLCVSDHHAEKREYFQVHGVAGLSNNKDAVESADILVLAVKPQNLQALLAEIKPVVEKRQPLIVSLALGWTTEDVAARFLKPLAIVRSMPNMPAIIQTGAVGLYANAHTSKAQKNQVEQIFRSVGLTVWLAEEDQIKLITALSGCGPAYFFRFMAAICDTAIAMGLDEKTAHLLTVQTAFGASKLALESQESFEGLMSSVASKGGATEAALSVFAQQGLDPMVKNAMTKAYERGEILAVEWRQKRALPE